LVFRLDDKEIELRAKVNRLIPLNKELQKAVMMVEKPILSQLSKEIEKLKKKHKNI